MKVKVNTEGCDEQYGERRVLLEDDQFGELAVHEMEFDSFNEFVEFVESVALVRVEESPWDEYDAEITALCRDL